MSSNDSNGDAPGYGDQGPAGQGGNPGAMTQGEVTGQQGQAGPQGTNGRHDMEEADLGEAEGGGPATKGGMVDDQPGAEVQSDLAGGSSSTSQ